ncbi:MAG: aminopeptidase P family protein [Bdellovibrionaceae bacterium]|nr:aminopeptidase P family protein [Pseudobdellovibrionaceae bacterium]
MRRPQFDMTVFKERRAQLAQCAPGSAVILPSHPEMMRQYDVDHRYRPDSNLFYLTGWEEPESVFVFRPGQTPESVLFVRKKDVLRETWDGFRYGPEGAGSEFHMDKTYLIEELDAVLPELLKPVERIYYRFNVDSAFDHRVLAAQEKFRVSLGRTGRGYLPIYDSWELLGEMRLKKAPYEAGVLRKACEITAKAHVDVMKAVKPGMNERQVQGIFLGSIFEQGAAREGYNTIVAGGAGATTLHYVFNDQPLNGGDLLLIDAGAEYEYFTGDITRTYPINGKFTEPQKRVYEAVLKVQKEIVGMIKPGVPFAKLQDATISGLVDVMLDLRLLKGDKKAIIESGEFRRYYPHGVSHWLGMDVHDAGLYVVKGESRPIEAGMAFTVEPGLYIPANDTSAPAEFRGIGVRIEDDILVTGDGCENMTAAAPKEIAEMEAIIGQGKA